MKSKAVSGITLTLLLIGMLILTFNIQPVKASGTIYIRADGSVEGTTHISSLDNITYTFTDSINDEIVVERDNIVVDGAWYTLQGTGSETGINMTLRSNVTIKNMEIKAFDCGIYLWESVDNTISGNNITNNWIGILLDESSDNTISGNSITESKVGNGIIVGWSSNNSISGNNITNNGNGIIVGRSSNNSISGNNITNNWYDGIWLDSSSDNTISGNSITNNFHAGILVDESSNNSISGNNIANSHAGIRLDESSDNTISGNSITDTSYHGIWLHESANNNIYHNNFVNNTRQVYDLSWDNPYHQPSINVWDDGYPSGGNYWSDYTTRYPDAQELDDSGIWDTPYVIDDYNQDNYPLMEPWTPSPPIPRTIDELKTEIEKCWSEGEIDNKGIVKSLIVKLNVVQKLVDKGKVEEAKSILTEDFIPQVQNLTGICMTVEAADILIQSAEYILSQL